MIKQFLNIFLILLLIHLSHNSPTSAYSECEQKVSRCFGLPDGCAKNKTCILLLTVRPTTDQQKQINGTDFNLYWFRDAKSENLSWTGAAISDDDKMGNDSVTECILWPNKTVTARQGMTFVNVRRGVNNVESVVGVTNQVGRYEDNSVWCSWTRKIKTAVNSFEYDLALNKYYILLAVGPMNGSKYMFAIQSDQIVNLNF